MPSRLEFIIEKEKPLAPSSATCSPLRQISRVKVLKLQSKAQVILESNTVSLILQEDHQYFLTIFRWQTHTQDNSMMLLEALTNIILCAHSMICKEKNTFKKAVYIALSIGCLTSRAGQNSQMLWLSKLQIPHLSLKCQLLLYLQAQN